MTSVYEDAALSNDEIIGTKCQISPSPLEVTKIISVDFIYCYVCGRSTERCFIRIEPRNRDQHRDKRLSATNAAQTTKQRGDLWSLIYRRFPRFDSPSAEIHAQSMMFRGRESSRGISWLKMTQDRRVCRCVDKRICICSSLGKFYWQSKSIDRQNTEARVAS